MIRKIGYFAAVIVVNFLSPFSINSIAQKQYARNPHVVYKVTTVDGNYTISYTFKDHYNNFQKYTIELPVSFTDSAIAVLGIPKWLFEPNVDSEYNRMIREEELASGLFKLRNNVIEIDKSAVIERYAETFCKPIAKMIVQSLEEYSRDTRRDRIELAIRFVQDIPYGIPKYADKNRHYGGVSPPPGILINGFGDCDSKALLFASILIYLLPANDFIFLNQSDHVLSAVREEPDENQTFVEFQGDYYLLAETAGPGKRMLGEKGNYYRSKFSIEPLNIDAPQSFPFKTPVSSYLPLSPEVPVEKNYLVIDNSSDRVFRFQLSPDNNHWKEFVLQENNSGNYKFDDEMSVYLRIKEKTSNSKIYKVQTGNAYRFSYNTRDKLWEFD